MASLRNTASPDPAGSLGAPASLPAPLGAPTPPVVGRRLPSISTLRWRKAWRDLWLHKLRSILVILSIAVGIFAFGIILGARSTITRELPRRYTAVAPASFTLHTSPIDDGLVESIRRMPEVAVATGRVSVVVRFLNGDGEWHDLQLFALDDDDYTNSQVNIIRPYWGDWPPGDQEILIERNSLFLTGADLNDELVLETADDHQRSLKLTGLVHDMNQLPAQVTGIPYGYVNRETLEGLGLSRDFNEVQMLVANDKLDKAHITRVAEEAREKVEKSGALVYWMDVPEPGRHLVEEFLPTIILLMTTLGFLALVLSAFLVINVITAIMTQQRPEIGIMKSVGARSTQVSSVYLRMVILLGFGALVLAIPLSALGAFQFSRFIAGQLNFDLDEFRPASTVIALEIVAGLLVPVLAALYPIRNATQVTVREAIQDYGIQRETSHRTPPSNRAFPKNSVSSQLLPVSRPLRISLRNTFRRKGRLARTLITLMLGGAIFMSVISVRASLFHTLEEALSSQGFDVHLQFDRPYRRAQIDQEAAGTLGVRAWETWRTGRGILVRGDESDGDNLILFALPPDTALYEPDVVAGRWLLPEDEAAIVVPLSLVRDEPGVALGEELTLRIAGEERVWRVVGVLEAFQPPIAPPTVYVNQGYYERQLGDFGRADLARLRVDPSAGYSDREVSQALQDRLQQAGMAVRSVHTASEDRDIFGERFNIITVILLIMAFLMATVGALGLMGTMSINVLERKREIGVMRAIGASDGAVLRIFVVEGVMIGILAWFGGILLSQPMSRLISRQIGLTFLERPLDFQYNWLGPLLWLLIVVVVSVVASLLPAYSAARLSVRETIAYE